MFSLSSLALVATGLLSTSVSATLDQTFSWSNVRLGGMQGTLGCYKDSDNQISSWWWLYSWHRFQPRRERCWYVNFTAILKNWALIKVLAYARADIGGLYKLNTADDTWTPLLDWVNNTNWYDEVLKFSSDVEADF